MNRYGDEASAIKMSEERLQGYIKDGVITPSKMCSCTTVHRLVDEIKKKVDEEEAN